MIKGFTTISDIQLYWKTCEDTFLASTAAHQYQDLKTPLATVYSHILEYQFRAICHLSSTQSSRGWRKVAGWSEWSDKASSIVKASDSCKAFLPPLQQREARENFSEQLSKLDSLCQTSQGILEAMHENRRDDLEARLMETLAEAMPSYASDKDFNPPRVDGTCEWFFTDDAFCKWRDGLDSGLFWFSADPGYGKSVLSRALVEEGHLQCFVSTIDASSPSIITENDSQVCYFFFKDDDERRTNLARALCAILHQLFSSKGAERLLQKAVHAFKVNGRVLAEKVEDLWKILVDCSETLTSRTIICVFDALDECDGYSLGRFVSLLKDYYRDIEKQRNIKFFITSRHYDYIERSFQPFNEGEYFFHFDGDKKYEEISSDINLVIDTRMDEFAAHFNQEERQRIAEHLKSRGTRTYLWLQLTLNIIAESPSEYSRPRDVEALLADIPLRLSEAYEKILCRSKNERITVVLLQILLAATVPLTLVEANYALSLALAGETPKTHAEVEKQLWKGDFKSIVKNFCGLIVNVYDGKVSFIHLTARTFLLLDPVRGMKWKGRFATELVLHQTICQCCLDYLLLEDWDEKAHVNVVPEHLDGMEKHPFLRYASNYWASHFAALENTVTETAKAQARLLIEPEGIYIKIWGRHFRHKLLPSFTGSTALAVASLLGIRATVVDILSEDADVNEWTMGFGSALHSAIWAGDENLVAMLLDNGADIYAVDGKGTSALAAAVYKQHLAIVRLLLSHLTDPAHHEAEQFRMAIDGALAATKFATDGEIFRCLLKTRVDLNTVEGIERAVIDETVMRAESNNVRMLLYTMSPDIPITQRMAEVMLTHSGIASVVFHRIMSREPGSVIFSSDMLRYVFRARTDDFLFPSIKHETQDDEELAIASVRKLLDNRTLYAVEITEGLLMSVAETAATYVMRTFLGYCDGLELVTPAVFEAAIRNPYEPVDMMDCLLQYKGDPMEITDRHLRAARWDAKMLGYLLNYDGLVEGPSERTLVKCMYEMSQRGNIDTLRKLCQKSSPDALANELVVSEIVRWAGEDTMRTFLEYLPESYVPSETVMMNAVRWRMIPFLADYYGEKLPFTPKVYMAATTGLFALPWVLQNRADLEVTRELIHATVTNFNFRVLVELKPEGLRAVAPIALEEVARYGTSKDLELLTKTGFITPDMIKGQVAVSMLDGDHSLPYLLEYIVENSDLCINESVLRKVATNTHALDLFNVIKKKRPADFCITEAVIEAAATDGNMDVLHYLSHQDPQLTIHEHWWRAARFRFAARISDIHGMRRELDGGADPNLPNADGVTTLAWVVANCRRPTTVEFLTVTAPEGVDVHAADMEGRTALHQAARNARLDVAGMLLDAGADPDRADHRGITPFMIADEGVDSRWGRHQGMVEVMREGLRVPIIRYW